MAKLKNPLFSLGTVGILAKDLVFTRRRKLDIIETKPIPHDAKSPLQLEWRHMYQKAVALWHALSAAEKLEWESLARPKHMTGFAWFMSQCLRPNPGIYLPLQGGTMQGDIDMATHSLLNLPLPTTPEEPVTFGGHLGARVYHNSAQSIPNDTATILSFDSESWDTDQIHDLIANNSRLTCKTPGKYFIAFNGKWAPNANGIRQHLLLLNGTHIIAQTWQDATTIGGATIMLSTLYDLALNDYLQMRFYHNSGGALSMVQTEHYSPYFMMSRIV